MITGKTLIALGYTPASWFGWAIETANKDNIRNEELIEFLSQQKSEYDAANNIIKPFEAPVFYHKNILATNTLEQNNVDSVVGVMDEIMSTPTVVDGAIMPDACPTGAHSMPVGSIAVAKNAIHPGWHSADICCSVYATCFGFTDPLDVLNAGMKKTHFGRGGRKANPKLSKDFKNRMEANIFLNDRKSLELAKNHLGTQGDGNHFLFVGVSENNGMTYMVTHHGSRGLGAHLYKKGKTLAEKMTRRIAPDVIKGNEWIDYNTDEGKEYWEALQIIRAWTKMNHERIHGDVQKSLKIDNTHSFWNEHNFVFKKGDLFYHAKCATPLVEEFVPDGVDGLRLIPLNMAEPILVVRGKTTRNNIGFAPHGAGRNFSRSYHKKQSVGTVEEVFNRETEGLDVRFYSGTTDISELPSAYKNAKNVQEQIEHFGLGTVVDRIMPYGCIMAGEQTFSYKNQK